MKIKDRIIKTSVNLFNKEGFAPVSLRRIAEKLDISVGNLAYHFQNKKIIVGAIYSMMEEEMERAVYPGADQVDLQHLDDLFRRIEGFHKKYRFFYLDLIDIKRTNPEIVIRYGDTLMRRREETRLLYQTLVQKGYLISPGDAFYDLLAKQMWISSTFWLQQSELLGAERIKESEVELAWNVLTPLLTERGLADFNHQIRDRYEYDTSVK